MSIGPRREHAGDFEQTGLRDPPSARRPAELLPRIEQESEYEYDRYYIHPQRSARFWHKVTLACSVARIITRAFVGKVPKMKEKIPSASSANLTLPDYGRVARNPPSIGNNRISSLLNRAAVMNLPSRTRTPLRDSTRILSSTRGRNRKVHNTRIRRGLPRTALSNDHKIIANAWGGSGWNS